MSTEWSPLPSHRWPSGRLVRTGLVLFAIGTLVVLVTVVEFSFGVRNRPLIQNLLAMLAPVGLVLAVVGVVRAGRADTRSNARLFPAETVAVPSAPPDPGRPEQALRVVAVLEALSWLVLIGATVVKYAADRPLGVQVMGPIHGTLFLAYIGLVLVVWRRRRWSPITAGLVLIESVVPGGGFLVARRADLRALPHPVRPFSATAGSGA